jgi:hypothetical protein
LSGFALITLRELDVAGNATLRSLIRASSKSDVEIAPVKNLISLWV